MARIKDLRTADGRLALFVARTDGISKLALHGRLKRGWDLGRAVTEPLLHAQPRRK